ncbi:hypothetical protein CMU00_06465 [Elizabethkingia anophelis]|nr:hypothetical protein [Elizabethkingia anophelis]
MNIYFLVEGKRTEMKVYPKWLSILIPKLTRVQWHHEISENNYCIFTGDGFPSLLDNHLKNSVDDINATGNFDYFVICLDSDDDSIDERRQQVLDFIEEEEVKLDPDTKLIIIVQNKCFETWFLGNQKIFKKNPTSSFLSDCIKHYNVKTDDPELMEKPADFEQSTAVFHSIYLQEILAERKIKYSKKDPKEVAEKYFLEKLIKRNTNTNHIQSFKYFTDFCEKINNEIS